MFEMIVIICIPLLSVSVLFLSLTVWILHRRLKALVWFTAMETAKLQAWLVSLNREVCDRNLNPDKTCDCPACGGEQEHPTEDKEGWKWN